MECKRCGQEIPGDVDHCINLSCIKAEKGLSSEQFAQAVNWFANPDRQPAAASAGYDGQLVMPRCPIEGKGYKTKDGRTLYIAITHKPCSGYGVTVSELTKSEFFRTSDTMKTGKYYPWHAFKKMVVAVVEVER